MNEPGAGRVVVGVVESPAGLQALRWATDEARRRGIGLRAVRAWHLVVPWEGSDVRHWRDEFVDEATAAVQGAFAAAMGGVPADLEVEIAVAEGPPGQTLVDNAGDDDLLVVGTSSRWWGRSAIANFCLRKARCPVVVVPMPAMARGGTPKELARQLRREADDYIATCLNATPPRS